MMDTLIDIRRWWMHLYGMEDKEIDQSIVDSPPISLEDEIRQLHAIFEIRSMNHEHDREV
jgi:hypothetical protein